MFHIAYLLGSLISTRLVLDEEIIKDDRDLAHPYDVLW